MSNIIDIKIAKQLRAWKEKCLNIEDTKVIFIHNNLCDVFLGEGWKQQVRIFLNRKEKSFTFSEPKNRSNKYLQTTIAKLLPTILRGNK